MYVYWEYDVEDFNPYMPVVACFFLSHFYALPPYILKSFWFKTANVPKMAYCIS